MKNRGERAQSLYMNHHEAIIRKDDFIAVQRMLDNNKYRHDHILPQLRVVRFGILGGFVNVHTTWGSFTTDDYINASLSVWNQDSDEYSEEQAYTINKFKGFEVVRSEYVSDWGKCVVCFGLTSISFNTQCIRKFPDDGRVELLIHPIRHCYERFGEDLDAALEEVRNIQKAVYTSSRGGSIFEKRTSGDYEKMRDTLILRPLNFRHYAPLLGGHIYRQIGDVALVLYMLVGDVKHSLTTSKIKREELEQWGISAEQAMDDALKNTSRLFPACVYDRRVGQEVDLLKTDFSKEDVTFFPRLFMISTFRTTNGAAALFYPGVLEKLLKVMDGPFEAVFMNINDVMIFTPGDAKSVEMAELAGKTGPYRDSLSEYRRYFDEIEFAVYCREYETRNYDVFKRVFK